MTSKHDECIMFRLTNEKGPGLPHMAEISDPLRFGTENAVGEKDFVAEG